MVADKSASINTRQHTSTGLKETHWLNHSLWCGLFCFMSLRLRQMCLTASWLIIFKLKKQNEKVLLVIICLLKAMGMNRHQAGWLSILYSLALYSGMIPSGNCCVTQKRLLLQLAASSSANQPCRLRGNQQRQCEKAPPTSAIHTYFPFCTPANHLSKVSN